MSKPRAAAIYARISSDPTGTAAGVKRQLADCRKAAEAEGWVVADEYVDNDKSAYSGKRRPEYSRMLADLESGAVDGVIVWHIDRLTRRPIELEQFVNVIDKAGVKSVKFVTGDADLQTGDGLFMARIMGNVAAKESADKSRRQRRKMDQLAAEGRITGGGPRPFGYEKDRITLRPVEADIVRDLVSRFLAGESLHSLAKWLSAEKVPTSMGKPWRTPTLRQMLASPRIAGLKEHRGETVGPAIWPAIISEDDHRRVNTLLAAKARSGKRALQTYLLTGMLVCGLCGNRLYSAARTEKNGSRRRRYVCSSGPDHGGCGKITVVAVPVEEWISEAILFRLDTPNVTKTLTGNAAEDARITDLSAEIEMTQTQLNELADAYAGRAITMPEWLRARRPIEEEQQRAQAALSRHTKSEALRGLPTDGEELRALWATLNLDRQHAIVRAVMDHAAIAPSQPGMTRFNPDRIQPTWRI